MAKEEKYYEQLADANTDRLRALLKELPGFCMEYFRSLKNDTEPRTRLEYAKAARLGLKGVYRHGHP